MRPSTRPLGLTSGVGRLCLFLAIAGCADPTSVAPTASRPSASLAAAGPSVVAIGNVIGYGVNDQGTIVGPSDGNKSSAYLWDASTGLKLVATGGLAWDVSQDGHAVGGKNAAGKPVLWTATSIGGTRTELSLPDAGFGGAVRAMVSDVGGSAVLMTGNVFVNGSTKTPAKWTPCTVEPGCTNGWLLTTVSLAPPIAEAWGQDIQSEWYDRGNGGNGLLPSGVLGCQWRADCSCPDLGRRGSGSMGNQ